MRITRRAFLGGVTAAASAAVLPALFAPRAPARRAPEPRRTGLRVLPAAPPCSAQQAADERRAAWLLVASVDPGARSRLAGELEAAMASEHARRNPFLVDLDEARVDDVLRDASPWLMPALSAARSLSAARWNVPGTAVAVQAHPSTHARAGDDVGWETGEVGQDPLLSRVRFAAWPLTRGLRVQGTERRSAARVAAGLRARACQPDSRIALVVDAAPQLSPACVAQWRALGAQAARGGSRGPMATLAASLAAGPPRALLPRWLELAPGALWALPRRSALATMQAFHAEVLGHR